MANLLRRLTAGSDEERYSLDTIIELTQQAMGQFNYNGHSYPFGLNQTFQGAPVEKVAATLPGYSQALKACPPAFAAQMVRALVLSQARFTFRNKPYTSTPRKLFGTTALSTLEQPWPRATTGELLARMEWHAGLAGNAYVARVADPVTVRLRVLRPDWTAILYGSQLEPDNPMHALDGDLLGYVYQQGGVVPGNRNRVYTLLPEDVAHWSPVPDPECAGLGMAWITPALREIQGDRAATEHKLTFFRNGATPNLVVKGLTAPDQTKFEQLVDWLESRHTGLGNAYRTLYLSGGADATVVGSDLKQLDFKATQGAGEPLALDTPIPTPIGWTTMGEVAPGDFVLGRDGRPARVVGVSPVHYGRECYRITFKDRTSIVADAGHEWPAIDRGRGDRAERIYTTEQIHELASLPYQNGVGGHRMAIPPHPILDLKPVDLLVDPYVLGAWLGDGQTAGAAICGADDDLEWIAAEIEARGYTTTRWSTAADKASVIGIPGGLLACLDALGVLGNKHIPAPYLRSSIEQRLDLLRGLMDTDGHVQHRGSCEFSTKWESLALQVADLVRSLGYRATVTSKADPRSRTGFGWRVFFRCEPDRVPFALPRKVATARAAGAATVQNRSIVSVERVESVPVRCIAVDTPDHLFLAGDGYVLTHNTRIAVLSRVPAPLLGISEGLAGSSLNAGNFGMARRMFADTWVYPSLQDVSSSLSGLVQVPSDSELWFDTADIPLLREDAKDAAEIESTQAATIVALVNGGFTADSAIAATIGQDMRLLKHTGRVSVQLQEPGTQTPVGATP